ncbi:MAG: hypothetical protein MUC48_23145 [Leptolyngbya sp. Prado105]|nr:hypothetical protein [Leptolyngbya sp. Prado105]
MTANQDQIQHLLSEIQDILAQGNPRLPWGLAAQIARQRQVLEQVRVHLQEALFQLNHADQTQTDSQAQTVMQSVIDEMNALRSTLLRPLHSEVATLMQQRNALVKEIRQLEAHRQMLEQPTAAIEGVSSLNLPGVNQADQALTSLDSTLHVVFESLQKDIQSYQDSLSQGIDKLHSLGQQSEAMFSGIVGRLAVQMGRDASAFLQTSSENPLNQPPLTMPYAGSEISPRIEATRSPSLETITVLTQLIDQLEVEVDEFPLAIPATPPRNGVSSGREVPSDLKSLFQLDSPKVEPTIDAVAYSELNQETTLEQLNTANEPAIFTLDGIEDLFLEEGKDQPNG